MVTTYSQPAPNSFPDETVTFTPGVWGVADDNDVPDGAIIASYSTSVKLGFLNSPCAGTFPPTFSLMDANANPNDPTPVPGGPENPLWPGFYDSVGASPPFVGSEATANGLPDAVDSWPSFLDAQLAAVGGATPHARYHGQTFVGTLPVSLDFVVFKPGDLAGVPASLGYGALSVLQNPFAATAPGAVTDTCTPLSTSSTTFGISHDNGCTPGGSNTCGFAPPDLGSSGGEGGAVVRTNPATGNYTFNFRATSARDAEGPCTDTTGAAPSAVPPYSTGITGDIGVDCAGDGIESGGDSCPTVANFDTAPATSSRGSLRGLRYGFIKGSFVTPGNDLNFAGNHASKGETFPAAVLGPGTAAFLNSLLDPGDPDRSTGSATSHGDGIDAACDPNGEVRDNFVAEGLGVPSAVPPTFTSCTDGADNDFDFLVDGADSGCIDSDSDGVADKQDNCDFVANPAQTNTDNPGNAAPAADQYGDACDPVAFAQSLADYDFDFFTNRQDNCPLVANGGAAQDETAEVTGVPLAPPAQQTDSIGDQCDPNPAVADGHFHIVLVSNVVSIGHDIELRKLNGPGINGGAALGASTKTYTVKVRNNTATAAENILVTLSVSSLGSCGPATVAAQAGSGIGTGSTDTGPVAFGVTAEVKFDVTYAGGCASGTASDYLITADASHDPTDGFSDSNPSNDAPISATVNDF